MSRIDDMADQLEDENQPSQEVIDRQQRTDHAFRLTLQTPNGRRMVHDLLSICHFGMSGFAEDPYMTAFVTGKQKVGEYLMSMINRLSPDAYFLMIKEAREEEDYDRQQRERASSNTRSGTRSGS